MRQIRTESDHRGRNRTIREAYGQKRTTSDKFWAQAAGTPEQQQSTEDHGQQQKTATGDKGGRETSGGRSLLLLLAGVPDGHAYRHRDTFSVELLLAGVPIERVSILLGHQSVRITEKHYAPWVRALQEQLEADVIGKDGIIQQLSLISGHPLLVQAALDAVRQWRYEPTLVNGQPVEVDTAIEVFFQLQKK